jgi:NTP pyrophosphatase (non-canonical NTP hydrolase)
MNINDYQEECHKTDKSPERGSFMGLLYTTIAMGGEVGEFQNKVKKLIRDADGHMSDHARKDLASELGDVLWYAATMAAHLGYTLEEVAQMNLDKLAKRLAEGKISGSGDHR